MKKIIRCLFCDELIEQKFNKLIIVSQFVSISHIPIICSKEPTENAT